MLIILLLLLSKLLFLNYNYIQNNFKIIVVDQNKNHSERLIQNTNQIKQKKETYPNIYINEPNRTFKEIVLKNYSIYSIIPQDKQKYDFLKNSPSNKKRIENINNMRSLKTISDLIYVNIINNLNDLKGNILKIYRNILNDEAIKEPWFIYFEDTKQLHKIYEGIAPETLNMGVGHFEETPIINGNIALAGHNRGYNSNPFEKLKNIRVGSKVIYKTKNRIYRYKIVEKEKIEKTDFSKIEREGSFLTLITCVENEKDYRLCVTAKEID